MKSLTLKLRVKYLGVQIDQNLEWKEHIKYVSSKVARAIGFLKYTKHFIPRNCLNKLYRSMWNHIFAILALFGDAVAQQKKTVCRNYKIGQQE